MEMSELSKKLAGLSKLADSINKRTADGERNWTAHLVISSEHAGLKPLFKRLEDEIYRALARIDDPKRVAEYLRFMVIRSSVWSAEHGWGPRNK